VEERREEEPEACFKKAFFNLFRRQIYFYAEASSTSALPDWLETERFPCFATGTPAPATTKAVVVEMLKVCAISPPVPQVSRTPQAL